MPPTVGVRIRRVGYPSHKPDAASNNAVRPVREMPVPLKFTPLIWDPCALLWRYPSAPAEGDPSAPVVFAPTTGCDIATEETPCPLTGRGAQDYLIAGAASEPLHGGEPPEPRAA